MMLESCYEFPHSSHTESTRRAATSILNVCFLIKDLMHEKLSDKERVCDLLDLPFSK